MIRPYLLFFSLFTIALQAQNRGEYIHEGFVTIVKETVALQAIDQEPPPPVTERIPAQPSSDTVWIPGYWHFDEREADFIWISGIWRRPPPGHQWISGLWQLFDEGEVWIPGFWSQVGGNEIQYLDQAPPDQTDENIPTRPPGEDYFWAPGFWQYLREESNYQWISGTFERLDPNWVYTPAHYIWREGGYVFVPAFWDWPLEERGVAYASQWIRPALRENASFEPTVILAPYIIVESLFFNYPNYLCFYQHHYYFHPEFWEYYCCTPPWWSWNSWWGLPWHDQWGLWWWWGHPGFPQPLWIDTAIANHLPPPNQKVIHLFQNVTPPRVITSQGVVKPSRIREAIFDTTNSQKPIIPDNQNIMEAIQSQAAPERAREILTPSGSEPDSVTGKLPPLQKPTISAPPRRRVRPDPQTLPTKPNRLRPAEPRIRRPQIQDERSIQDRPEQRSRPPILSPRGGRAETPSIQERPIRRVPEITTPRQVTPRGRVERAVPQITEPRRQELPSPSRRPIFRSRAETLVPRQIRTPETRATPRPPAIEREPRKPHLRPRRSTAPELKPTAPRQPAIRQFQPATPRQPAVQQFQPTSPRQPATREFQPAAPRQPERRELPRRIQSRPISTPTPQDQSEPRQILLPSNRRGPSETYQIDRAESIAPYFERPRATEEPRLRGYVLPQPSSPPSRIETLTPPDYERGVRTDRVRTRDIRSRSVHRDPNRGGITYPHDILQE